MPRKPFCRISRTCKQTHSKEAYQSITTEAIKLGDGRLLVIRNIPCYKCRECDEVLYIGDIVERLERITENAKELMQELMIVDYAKAA